MNKQLQEKLYKDFPDLFIQKDWPKEETCMCWGIDAGDGWYQIIRNACEAISNYKNSCNFNLSSKDKNYYNVQFSQIKTKFGELRINIDENKNDSYVKGLISATEYMANKTCFYCGQTATKERNNNPVTSCGPFAQKYSFKPPSCVKCKELSRV